MNDAVICIPAKKMQVQACVTVQGSVGVIVAFTDYNENTVKYIISPDDAKALEQLLARVQADCASPPAELTGSGKATLQ